MESDTRAASTQETLLPLLGQLLAVWNRAENPTYPWAKAFRARLMARATRETRHTLQQIAAQVQRGLGRDGSRQEREIHDALAALRSLVSIQATGIMVDDPFFLHQQVVYRSDQERIVYGQIVSTFVFLCPGTASDGWGVRVPGGMRIDAASSAFVRYDGPPYQPGTAVVVQRRDPRSQQTPGVVGTILGPHFGIPCQCRFDVAIQRPDRREILGAVPFSDLAFL
jgi:hypothetical protein